MWSYHNRQFEEDPTIEIQRSFQVWPKYEKERICWWSITYKHGEGSVIYWVYMAASGTDSLVFNDATHDGGNEMNSKVYTTILSGNLQKKSSNLIRKKITPNTKPRQQRTWIWGKSGRCEWPSHWNITCISLQKSRLTGEQLKEAAVKAWNKFNSLVKSMGHGLDAVIKSKRYGTKY